MPRRSFWVIWVAIACFVLSVCAYTIHFLQIRFGGYDLSPLIDCGWRVLQGEVPNRDFICTFPPILYLGVAFAFRLMGERWIALSILSSTYTLLLTLGGMRILLLMRKKLGDDLTLRLSVAYAVLQALPFLVVGHPWHSSWTEAADLYAFVAAFALLGAENPSRREHAELFVHLCVAECLIVLAKPNTGMPALVFCTIALLIRRRTRGSAVSALAAAIVAASAMLAYVHTSLIRQWQVYSKLNARFLPQGYLEAIVWDRDPYWGLAKLSVYVALFPALLWVLWRTGVDMKQRRLDPVHILALGGCLVTIIGFGTNAEFHIVDAPMLLLGTVLLGALSWTRSRWFESGYFYALYSLLVVAAFFCGTRERMQGVGVWGQDSCGVWLERASDPFFGNFKACSPFFSVLHETDRVVAAHPGARVFFGPRMEFMYAREHRPSPKGLPLWWHPGTSFPVGDEQAILDAWQADHFGLMIFLHDDRTRMPKAILDEINRDYIGNNYGPDFPGALGVARIDVYTPK